MMNEAIGTHQSKLPPDNRGQGQKAKPLGSKIEKSQYREEAIEMIGKGSSDSEIARILQQKGFKVTYATVGCFRKNYVLSNSELKEKVSTELLKIEEKRTQVKESIPVNILKRIEIKQELIKKYEVLIAGLEREQADRDKKGRFSSNIASEISKNYKLISDEQNYIDKFLQGFAAESMLQNWFYAFLQIALGTFIPEVAPDKVDAVSMRFRDQIFVKYKEFKDDLHKK